MRILCVIDCLGMGGAQRQLVELAIGFKQSGHDVSFLTYHDIPFFDTILEKNHIPNVIIKGRNYLDRLILMRRHIRSGGFDAVLSFLEGAGFICEAAGFPYRKWKLVVGERSANPNIRKSVKLRFFRLFHLFADYVVANSSDNIKLVRSLNPCLPERKCKVIYNSVDFEKWKTPSSFVFRKEGVMNIVIAARFDGLKNSLGLVKALSMLKQEELDQIHVQWYGVLDNNPIKTPAVEKTIKLIREHRLDTHVSLKPAVNDIITITQEADAVGLFSMYEGLPNSVCEGMACAKPVLSSAISDLPRLLSNQPQLLFDPTDPASISFAFRQLIHTNIKQLQTIGAENRKTAMDNFHKGSIVSTYLQLFESD